jgi:putative ABC transport system permease protein
MFKHLFKLMWNKRKQNFLLLSEILVSFMVIFALFSFLVYYFQNYQKPLGLKYERVWTVAFDNRQLSKNTDSLAIFYENLENSLKAMPQISEIGYTSSNYPFSESSMSTVLKIDKREIDRVNRYMVGQNYHKVLSLHLLEGRWFTPEDAVAKDKAIVINETLKFDAFGGQSPIGKYFEAGEDKKRLKVIGVVQDAKVNGDYWPSGLAMYNQIDTGYLKYNNHVLLKVNESADANFESKLYKFFGTSFKQAWVEITYLKDQRNSKNELTQIPMIIFMIVAGFLIINVALGLFGVLWYNINKRRGEIGLRRAIGATGNGVSWQLVTESMILATLSIIVGCFFAFQFPLLNVFDVPASVYLFAILFSILFIYLLVFVCSLYPGKQAAGILPATALHEE